MIAMDLLHHLMVTYLEFNIVVFNNVVISEYNPHRKQEHQQNMILQMLSQANLGSVLDGIKSGGPIGRMGTGK